MEISISDELNAIINYSRDEAMRTGSYGIAPDHLFLGIIRHAENNESKLGIKSEFDERLFTALLFSEGGASDARTIRGRAETFYNEELFELFRLVGKDNSGASVDNLKSSSASFKIGSLSYQRLLIISSSHFFCLLFFKNIVYYMS